MYFENIPKIFYDSMNIGRPKVVTNLLRRVSVRANIKANTLLLDTNTKIEVYNNSALYNGDKDFYSTAVAITNREHEEIQQNIKRQIRLLDPVYIEEFKEEYINLINETSI